MLHCSLILFEVLQTTWWTIFAHKHVVGIERNQFAHLVADTWFMKPLIARSTQKFHQTKIPLLPTVTSFGFYNYNDIFLGFRLIDFEIDYLPTEVIENSIFKYKIDIQNKLKLIKHFLAGRCEVINDIIISTFVIGPLSVSKTNPH